MLGKLNRGLVRIRGVDASKFLQTLISNDIRLCTPSRAIYSFLLTPQSRYLFDFFIYTIAQEEFLLDVQAENLKPLITKLHLYKLRSRVDIDDVSAEYAIYYQQLPMTSETIDHLHQWQDPRYSKLGKRILTRANSEPYDEQPYLEDKYKYTIPDGESELHSSQSIPIMYGADSLNAISYNKGCYIGQELISRTRSQGVVRKKLFKVISDKDISNVLKNINLYHNQQSIGILCSSYQNLGIALIKEEQIISMSNFSLEDLPIELAKAEWY